MKTLEIKIIQDDLKWLQSGAFQCNFFDVEQVMLLYLPVPTVPSQSLLLLMFITVILLLFSTKQEKKVNILQDILFKLGSRSC